MTASSKEASGSENITLSVSGWEGRVADLRTGLPVGEECKKDCARAAHSIRPWRPAAPQERGSRRGILEDDSWGRGAGRGRGEPHLPRGFHRPNLPGHGVRHHMAALWK